MYDAVSSSGLSFSYKKGKRVLDNIGLHVPNNAIYGLIGNNGSGKSTVLKLITGLLPLESGSLTVLGQKEFTSRLSESIGFMIESPSFFSYMTVLEHMRLLDIVFEKGNDYIIHILELTGLINEMDKKAKELSSGQKQRLGFAMALFRDPKLLILDEPTNGLDPGGVIDFRNIILGLHEQGKTIICTNHILSELDKICTHIGILNAGHLLFQGETNEIQDDLESFFMSIISASEQR